LQSVAVQGKAAEKVAEEAATSILKDLQDGGCTDEYLQVRYGRKKGYERGPSTTFSAADVHTVL
jgi:hypothetical protein